MNNDAAPSLIARGKAYFVHAYTASGVLFAFLAAAAIIASPPSPQWVFIWLAAAFAIDATDGLLARRWQVKRFAPRIDGRTIDDIVDYMTYTFLPLLLMWRMEWLLPPAGMWVGLAMVASLFGFANTGAKQEDEGFFLGFPSYWNVFAFYAGLWVQWYSALIPTIMLVLLVVLTFLPVRFLYPNLAPRPWRMALYAAGGVWVVMLGVMLFEYPDVAPVVFWISTAYPTFYVVLSVYLDSGTTTSPRKGAPPAHSKYPSS